jgi:hypothetical protein
MKAQMGTLRDLIPTDLPSLGSPWRLSGAASLHGRSRTANRLRVADVVISSVPGPPGPLYLAGTAAIAPEAKAIAIAAASTGAKRRVRRAKPIEAAAAEVPAEIGKADAVPAALPAQRRPRARRRAGARA